MKFTVELDDFYMDEDGNGLESELKEFIKRQVLNDIWGKVKDLAKEQISIAVAEVINNEIKVQVEVKVASLIETGVIRVNSADVPFMKYLENQFVGNSGWSNPNDYLKRLAKEFGDQLKKQYDVVFANHIVQQIHVNGMLKEDVAKLLLTTQK